MRTVFFVLSIAALILAGCTDPQADAQEVEEATTSSLSTHVLTRETAQISSEEWGEFAQYFSGETAGVTDLLSGTATINPGLEIHPPHRHAEEEFLMVIEGEGEWTVRDEVFPARAGDMIYAAAWDLHGIKNTGDEPLTFVFWKWNSKGLPVPVDPEL